MSGLYWDRARARPCVGFSTCHAADRPPLPASPLGQVPFARVLVPRMRCGRSQRPRMAPRCAGQLGTLAIRHDEHGAAEAAGGRGSHSFQGRPNFKPRRAVGDVLCDAAFVGARQCSPAGFVWAPASVASRLGASGCLLLAGCRLLYVACCVLRVACCTLSVACRLLRVARRLVGCSVLHPPTGPVPPAHVSPVRIGSLNATDLTDLTGRPACAVRDSTTYAGAG